MSETIKNTGIPDAPIRFARAPRLFDPNLENQVFNFCVIGAGINGSSTTRDLALRGFSVAVIDKFDPRKPSNTSSRMMHPGIRYLEHMEFGLVLESIREIKNWFKIAPHLVQPLSMIIPAYTDSKPPYWQLKIGMLIYDAFAWISGLPLHTTLSKEAMLKKIPNLARPENLVGGFNYTDGQAAFAERISIESLRDAKNHGATLLKHNEVIGIDESPELVTVTMKDQLSGTIRKIKAKYVINASGPWVDQLLDKTHSPFKPKTPQMGPTKGTHIMIKNTLGLQHAVYRAAKDGRPFFIIPFPAQKPEHLLIGTTDERKTSVVPTQDEIRYLLDSVNQAFSGANFTETAVYTAMAGYRPLPASDKNTGAVTRKHIIRRIGKSRIFHIIGGKLTTARNLAEQASDQATKALLREMTDRTQAKSLSKSNVCKTADTPLPGGKGLTDLVAFKAEHVIPAARQYYVSAQTVDELINRYGRLFSEVLKLTKEDYTLRQPLTSAAPLIRAQVLHAIRYENAETLTEIFTESLKLDLLPGHGLDGVKVAADILAKEKQLTPDERQQEIDDYKRFIIDTMAWKSPTDSQTQATS